MAHENRRRGLSKDILRRFANNRAQYSSRLDEGQQIYRRVLRQTTAARPNGVSRD
jgi:hypothetical protein